MSARRPRIGPLSLAIVVAVAACSGAGDTGNAAPQPADPDSSTLEAGAVEGAYGRLAPGEAIEAGVDAYYAGELERAVAAFEAARHTAGRDGDTASLARTLTWLGLASRRAGDYAVAREQGERALALKLAAGLDDQLFKSYNALGLLAWDESRLTDAYRLFERAGEAAERVGDEAGVAKAAGNLALIQTDLAEFAAARAGFERMRRAGRRLEDPVVEANGLTNLAMLDVQLGDPESALGRLREALRLYRDDDNLIGQENALAQLGTAYAARGELALAHAAYDSALALARAHRMPQAEAADLELLAELFQRSGDFARALRHYAMAREINRRLGDVIYTGIDLRAEATILAELDDLARATERAREALEAHRSVGARYQELQDLIVLAELAQRAGRPGDVSAHLAAATSLVDDIEAPVARVELALARARIADERGDPRGVLAAVGPVRPELARGGYAARAEAAALRARALLRLERLEAATEAAREAVASYERVRSTLRSGVLRASYASARQRSYADLAEVLLRRGRVVEAWEVADRARIGTVGGTSAGEDASGELAASARADELLRRIDRLAATRDSLERRGPGASASIREVAGRLEEARTAYEDLLARVGEARSRPAAALLGVGTLDLEEVQASLAEEELLVQYLSTPERVLIFAVSREDVRVAESPVARDELTARVRLARELVGNPDTDAGSARPVLETLHRLLIAPALRLAADRTVHRLVVVPQGVLDYLPFGALRDPVTGRYLVEDYVPLYLPSASALSALRTGGGGTSPGGTPARAAALFAPFPESLPASEREVRGLAGLLEESTAIVGPLATEGSVRAALDGGGIVHLASHAVLNARNPMFSRIELSPDAGGGPEDDGRLEVHEVMGMEISAPLVFLSGCDTGLSGDWSTDFAPGSDFATLARAFLFAGAGSVVATLWRVDDASSAELARAFYRALGDRSPAEALAYAQRRLLADEERAAPFHWAAFRFVGAPPVETSVRRDVS